MKTIKLKDEIYDEYLDGLRIYKEARDIAALSNSSSNKLLHATLDTLVSNLTILLIDSLEKDKKWVIL